MNYEEKLVLDKDSAKLFARGKRILKTLHPDKCYSIAKIQKDLNANKDKKVDHSTISRICKKMREKRWVEEVLDFTKDGRKKVHRLTEKGKKINEGKYSITPQSHDIDKVIGWTKEKTNKFLELLEARFSLDYPDDENADKTFKEIEKHLKSINPNLSKSMQKEKLKKVNDLLKNRSNRDKIRGSIRNYLNMQNETTEEKPMTYYERLIKKNPLEFSTYFELMVNIIQDC